MPIRIKCLDRPSGNYEKGFFKEADFEHGLPKTGTAPLTGERGGEI
jgi:hypothetical protein